MITIAIPNYNYCTYVLESIESVLEQSTPDIEILVYDDASTDNSVECIRKTFADKLTLMEGRSNGGIGAARNILINHAKGDYILFLDSDDLLAPGAVKALSKASQGKDVVFGMVHSFCDKQTQIASRHEWLNSGVLALKSDNSTYKLAQISSAWNKLISTDFIRKNQIHFSEIRVMEDCLFAYLLAFAKPQYAVVDDIIVNIRQHDNSLSSYSSEQKVRLVLEVTKELTAETRSQSVALQIRLFGNNLAYFLTYTQHNPNIFKWILKHKSLLARRHRAIIAIKLVLVSRLFRYLRFL